MSPKEKEAFSIVQTARTYISRAYARAQVDIDNLESVFTAIEMGEFLAKTKSDLDWFRGARESLVRLIVATLQHSTRFNVGWRETPSPETVTAFGQRVPTAKFWTSSPPITRWHFTCLTPHSQYHQLAMLRRSLLERGAASVDFVSFNYDLALEVALSDAVEGIGHTFSYGLDGISDSECLVAKLHGSLSWIDKGGTEKPVEMPGWRDRFFASPRCDGSTTIELWNDQSNGSCFIIPPSESKREKRRAIQAVWQAASERLRLADTIVFAGFSLPSTDVFFREFFAMSSIAGPASDDALDQSLLRKIVIINPAGEVRARYDAVLDGQAAHVCEFVQQGLLQSMRENHLLKLLEL